jgi:hypothetical protein
MLIKSFSCIFPQKGTESETELKNTGRKKSVLTIFLREREEKREMPNYKGK